jgi:hypothetical protein
MQDVFIEFLKLLNAKEVEYVVLGGYVGIVHGYVRTTANLDILTYATE